MTSALDTFYVSGGTDLGLNTLEISDGVTTFYFVEAFEDVDAYLETGELVTFKACAMQVALPARNADGTQDLKFAICNIDGSVSTQVRASLAANRKASVTYREYLDSDRGAPARPPVTLEVKKGQWTAMQVDITAGYMNILDTAWPRELYTLNKFPGIRYIA